MKKITESFHDYKGYRIRLRAATFNGFWYSIIKDVPNASSPNGIKHLYLRERGFNFIESAELLKLAKKFIDEFPDRLEKKFNDLQSAHLAKT